MRVYVVTSPELGWDCVVGVYSTNVSLKELDKEFPSPQYVISDNDVEQEILS